MKKILIAALLVAASLNVVACASSDSSASEMSARTKQAQNAANDSLRK
jgi:major membrane immunogen (membrane-anchored lipoprotein)